MDTEAQRSRQGRAVWLPTAPLPNDVHTVALAALTGQRAQASVWEDAVTCLSLHSTSDTHVVFFSHPQSVLRLSGSQLAALPFNSSLTLPTRSKHRIPRVKGSVPRDRPCSRCLLQVPGLCTSDGPTVHQGCHDTCVRTDHLLEQLAEFREAPYLYLQVYYNRYYKA